MANAMDGHVSPRGRRGILANAMDGHVAGTAIVKYLLSFADLGKKTSISVSCKQTEVCLFRSQQTNGSCSFPLVPFSVPSSVSTEVDLWNCAEVGNFSKLVFIPQNSTELR